MNSKILFFFIFFIGACGLKNDPVAPKDSYLPSLLENYPDVKTKNSLDETPRK